MFKRYSKRVVLFVLPTLLAACATSGHDGGSYQPQPVAPAVQSGSSYVPPPVPPSQPYSPPQVNKPPIQPPPRAQRKVMRTADLNSYCKQRGFTGVGTHRNGQPICVTTSMGFNTTFVSKSANINFADVCNRQHRTSQYQLQRGRVECIAYVD
jgi:hypothetical protein